MRRWSLAIALVATVPLWAVACWKTKPNPQYCSGVDGGCDMTAPSGDGHMPGDGAPMCTTNAECTDPAKPVCHANGTCGTCSSSAQCNLDMGQNVCDTTKGLCVECIDDSTCGGHVCQNDVCVPCTKHSDCTTTHICDIDAGTCAAPSDVIYVDNVACMSVTPDGTSAKPFCQVNDALMLVTTTKKYISVAGNGPTHLYQAISWTTGNINVQVIGPGKTAALAGNGASVKQSMNVAANISAAPGTTVAFLLDGLELVGDSAPTPQDAVVCSGSAGTAKLIVRDSYIDHSGGAGLTATKCTVKIDRSLFEANTGSLNISGGSFDIENSAFVGGQMTTTPPIELSTSSAGTFQFNTVVGYTASMAVGVDCGAGVTQTIAASIVYGNTAVSGSQFGAKCSLSNTVVGMSDTTTGGIQANPVFKADGYHLVKGMNPMIVNQLASGPLVDIDDINRPIGPKWDIGANEVE